MDDRCIMESLLLTSKGVCDLYMHGTIESSTANVHQTFHQALSDSSVSYTHLTLPTTSRV